MRTNLFDKILVLGLLLFSSFAAAQITVNTNFDPRTNQPIDIRDTLTFLADTSAVTWTYPGLVAYAADADQFWYYTGSFWKRVVQDPFFSNLQDVDTAGIDVDDIAQWDGSNWVMTSPVELIGDGGGAYGSGLAGRTAYWLDDTTLVHTAIAYSSTELNASALTGSFQWPTGTTAQQPVGANGKTRFNSTTGLFEGYHDAAYRPFATFDGTRTSGRVPYWDGTKLTTSDGFVFDASVNELRINTAGVDMGGEKLQVNGSGIFGTPLGDRIIIGGSSGEIYTPIWGDNLRLGARHSVATSYIEVRGDGKVNIIAQDNDSADGVYIKNDDGGNEVVFDLVLNRINLHGNYTIRGATSNHVTLMGGDVYCTGCTSPGPRGYDVFIRGGNGNNLSNRRGFGGDVFIQAYDSMAVVHTLMQFMPDNFTILTPKVVEPTTSWDWVYVMDADSMRKVTAADIVAAGSGSTNSIYNLLPTQDILIDPNANDLIIGSFGAGNSGDFEFFTTNEDGQYAGVFAGTRDSSWMATAGDGFQFDAALFSTGPEDGVMGVNYEYFGTVWNAAVFGDSVLFAPYPSSELTMTINGLTDMAGTGYKVMVQDTITDRVYLVPSDSFVGGSDNQVIDTISFSGDTLRISLEDDGQEQKEIALHGLTSTTLTAAPSTDHVATGTKIVLTANENQAFGDVCFINADGEAQLGDADAIATSSCIAMCTETVTANNTATYILLGMARDDTWTWTVGGLIYLSTTGTSGNTLTQTAPSGTDDVIQILGVATHADRIYFKPELVQIELN